MIRFRHELKYLVSEAQALALAEYIRPFMYPDHHSPGGRYPLVSLYLDSDDLRLCRESLDGLKNRFKLRVRSYSDAPDAPCFFEIKRRINQVIVKSRSRVARGAAAALLASRRGAAADGDCLGDRNLNQFLFYCRQLHARPVMRVRYARDAFESRAGDDLRITFDRDFGLLATPKAELGLNGPGWQCPPQRNVILEIKFTTGYPRWISHMVAHFSLRPQSVSKYARAVTHACALRFCAPRVYGED